MVSFILSFIVYLCLLIVSSADNEEKEVCETKKIVFAGLKNRMVSNFYFLE